MHEPLQTLADVFGFASFRPQQREIVQRLIDGERPAWLTERALPAPLSADFLLFQLREAPRQR